MKLTSFKIMESLGLKIGDRILWNNEKYTLCEAKEKIVFLRNENGCIRLKELIDSDEEFMIVKKAGELTCGDFTGCDNGCPLCWLCTHYDPEILRTHHQEDTTLYEVLEKFDFDFADEVYDIFKKRLDEDAKKWMEE